MKTLKILVLLLCLGGCASKEEAIVCTTQSHDNSTNITLTYTYNNDNQMTKIKKIMRVSFDEQSLAGRSLQTMRDDIARDYKNFKDVKGLTYKVTKNEKKQYIEVLFNVDIMQYDFKKDEFKLGKKENYKDVEDAIDEITELGYYRCQQKK